MQKAKVDDEDKTNRIQYFVHRNRVGKSQLAFGNGQGANERKKIMTNICYLQDQISLTQGFIKFVQDFTKASYQYARFQKHIDLILRNPHFIPIKNLGYASPLPYLKRQIKNWSYLSMLIQRILFLLKPDRLWAACRGWYLTKRAASQAPDLATHFAYWLYVWTNMGLKYKGLQPSDFDLYSVDKNFDRSTLALDAQLSETEKEENRKEGIKVDVQNRFTLKALQQLIQTEKASLS